MMSQIFNHLKSTLTIGTEVSGCRVQNGLPRPQGILVLLVTSWICLSLSGCIQFGAAVVDSNPQGAQVYEFGTSTLLGVTPFTYVWREGRADDSFIPIKESQHVTAKVVKPGFQTKMEAFSVPLKYSREQDALIHPVPVLFILTPTEKQ